MSDNNAPPPDAGDSARATGNQSGRNERYRMVSLGLLVMLLTAGFGIYGYWISVRGLNGAVSQTSKFLAGLSGQGASSQLLVLGPVLALFALVGGLLVRHGLPTFWESVRRSALVGLLLGGCLLGAGLLASGKLQGATRLPWLFFVPIVPPVLLGYQALVVWRQRPRSLGGFKPGVSKSVREALERDGVMERFETTHRQLQQVFGGQAAMDQTARNGAHTDANRAPATNGGAYEPAYFVTNFAVPALLLLLVGFGALSIAWGADGWGPGDWLSHVSHDSKAREYVVRGLRWGVAGSFVYVLTEFASRLFRSDLTVGATTWGIVTLIVGPALAVTLSVAWKMAAGDSPWQTGVVLFFAGLAPRRVVAIIENVALQILKTQNDVPAPARLTPLTGLRSISSEVALRLREENIEDAGSLAYADPIRLVQSLPYDLRQVVDWIDQALLAITLPDQYDALSKRGVSGAIDLAWRWLRESVKEVDDGFAIKPDEAAPANFKALVNGVEADATVVYQAAAQLFYEEQVCLLWVMYNSFSTTSGGADQRIERLFEERARNGNRGSAPPEASASRLRTPESKVMEG